MGPHFPVTDPDPEFDEATQIYFGELIPRLIGALGPVTPVLTHSDPLHGDMKSVAG